MAPPASGRTRCMLVLVGRADPLDAAAARSALRVGAARPRRAVSSRIARRDARRHRTAARGDVIWRTSSRGEALYGNKVWRGGPGSWPAHGDFILEVVI